MAHEWVILVSLLLNDLPQPVYVSSERFAADEEAVCKRRALEMQEHTREYLVECIPVHGSE